MSIAIIHARVSTDEQAAEQLPIKSQVDAGYALAEKLGAKVSQVFVEEGVSGRSMHRGVFLDAIQYCEKHDAFRFSRQSRGSHSASVFKERLARVGTQIVYSSSGLTVDLCTPEGFLREGMDELLGNYYSIKIAQDTMRSMKNNATNGYFNGGRVPYGYQVFPDGDNPKRRRLAINPGEGLVVQAMFRKRLGGMGAKNLARWLNAQGYSNRDRSWNKASVTGILRNEAVIGRTVFNRYDKTHGKRLKDENEWIRVDSHEPIIDIGTWQIVQEMMNEGMQLTANAGSPKSKHLFTGLCRCAKCGSVMQAKSSRGGKYYYYECRAKEKYGSCDQKGIRLDQLEKLLVDTICKRVFNPDSLRKIVNEINELYVEYNKNNSQQWQRIECQFKTLDKDINNLLDVLQVVGTTKDGSQEIIERLRLKTLEKNKLESVLDNRMKMGGKVTSAPLKIDVSLLSEFLTDSVRKKISEPVRVRQFFSEFVEKVLVSEVQLELFYRLEKIIKTNYCVGVPNRVGRKFSWLPETCLLSTKTVIVPLVNSESRYSLTP